MNIHGNARLSVSSRQLLVDRIIEEQWTIVDAAEAAGVSERTARKWRDRYLAEGADGLADRSCAPKHVANRTPDSVVEAIRTIRQLRKTAVQIALALKLKLSTVSAVLKRIGLGKLSRLEPPEPPNRYCRRHPGELVHVDVKKLGRFDRPGHRVLGRGQGASAHVGFEAVHVCVDDYSRLAYVEVLPDETAETTTEFFQRACAWFEANGIDVKEVLSDNGAPYRSHLWARHCRDNDIKHRRTRPYRPRTNGKAERFIQTMLREWAYAATYRSSDHRQVALGPWLRFYNQERPHGSLTKRSPFCYLEQGA